MRPDRTKMAWIITVLSVIVLITAATGSLFDERLRVDLSQTVVALEFLLVGALVATRRPDNRVGWTLLAAGGITALTHLLGGLTIYSFQMGGSVPGARYMAAVYSFLWLPGFALVPTYGLLYFPTGRLLSPRWRIVWWSVTGGFAVLVSWYLLASWRHTPGFEHDFPGENPFHVHVLDPVLPAAFNVGAVLLLAGIIGCVVSLVVRYRRSQGDERLQMKWIAYAVFVGAVLYFTGDLYNELISWSVIGLIVLSAFPITLGVAVLKYRLYDIDIVISKTLVFAGLAGFITAIYVGIVVGVGTLLGAGDEPNLALSIVATGVVAVAFQPVRERLTRLANRLVFGKRATPYEVLSRFSSHLGDTVATEDTLEKMARLLADGTGAAHAQVSLTIGGQLVPAASFGSAEVSAEAHTVEVLHQGETLGALSVTKKRGETLTPADVKLVDDLAAQAGLLLRNVRLTEELKAKIVDLRASRQRLVAAQDAERRRLERDLHDGAQQQIVAMKLKLGIARTLAERENAPQTFALVGQLTEQTDDAVQTLRELAHGIYPPLLAAEGLQAAISTAVRRAPVPVVVETDGIGRYGQDIEAAVYFCVLEAITNATKYASPAQVTVRLADTDGQLTFEISDDGTGFDPDTTPTGHGLTNMTDRLDALEGHLHITSQPGNGTAITGALPAETIGANA